MEEINACVIKSKFLAASEPSSFDDSKTKTSDANKTSKVQMNKSNATKSEIAATNGPITSRSGETDASKTKVSGENSIFRASSLLAQGLKKVFLNQENCDVTLRVKEQDFKAHQIILKAQSPVFRYMFQSDTKEKATGIVDIQDIDPSSFSDFLCFLYCEELDNLSDENVFSLFTTADKYKVCNLRAKCVEYMKQNLSVDIFGDVIRLALLHSERELIQLSINFFITNALKIIRTCKWQMFLAEYPIEGNELFIKFVSSFESTVFSSVEVNLSI